MDLSKLETVKVDLVEGIAWGTMNRPEKRKAMSPQVHEEMIAALRELAVQPDAKALVLTVASESGSAGQDFSFAEAEIAELRSPRAV